MRAGWIVARSADALSMAALAAVRRACICCSALLTSSSREAILAARRSRWRARASSLSNFGQERAVDHGASVPLWRAVGGSQGRLNLSQRS